MKQSRKEVIVNEARALLNRLWSERDDIWLDPPSTREALFPLNLEIVIRDFLGLTLEKPDEIPSVGSLYQQAITAETAGFVDRPNKRIVIAQKFKEEWRRFTAAHEVAHWILHPSVRYHRDIPITGGEREKPSRPPDEQEADLFAAALLMPRTILTKLFDRNFGGPIDGSQPDEELATWLSMDSVELASGPPLSRALLVSKMAFYKGKRFVPLAQRFGVSMTAMAIQLRDYRLVM